MPPTPPATLTPRARDRAEPTGCATSTPATCTTAHGGTTYCPGCGAPLIVRDWYELTGWGLDARRALPRVRHSGGRRLRGPPGDWGRKRQPVQFRQ